jgi:hypothetical protein
MKLLMLIIDAALPGTGKGHEFVHTQSSHTRLENEDKLLLPGARDPLVTGRHMSESSRGGCHAMRSHTFALRPRTQSGRDITAVTILNQILETPV